MSPSLSLIRWPISGRFLLAYLSSGKIVSRYVPYESAHDLQCVYMIVKRANIKIQELQNFRGYEGITMHDTVHLVTAENHKK